MFTINVLLVGGTESFFLTSIVDRLLKERCDVYHIAGKSSSKAATKNRRVVTYNIDVDDEYVQFVVHSVMPDAIIYLGAFDDRHIWKDYHRCSAKYMCELTNILVTASDLGVKKFIYLSTINVYGFNNEGIITEETDISPTNVKSIIVAQGERLCKDFSDGKRINTISLRFGLVYGDLQFQSIYSDYVMRKCLDALVDRKMVINNQIFPLIYVTDAAIAVYKAVYLEGESGAYNVCDDETVSDAEICDIILTEYSEYDIELSGDESYIPQDYSIDGTKFKNKYSYFQKTKYTEGLQMVAQYVRDNQYRLHKQKSKKPVVVDEKRDALFYIKFLAKKLIPFFETLAVFILFAGLDYLFRDSFYLNGVDFMLMFVIIVSITFGKRQALVAVLLSLLYFVGFKIYNGEEFLDILISVEFIVRIMFLFIVGLIIGHVRDRLHQKINELEAYNEYLTSEYSKLDEINDVTVQVKQELEERLLTYSDSLATNYAIIEQVDSLLPLKTYFKAMSVMCNILKTKSVSVYARNRLSPELRLSAWTTPESKRLGETIDLRYLQEINESFLKGQVYSNKTLNKDLPLLAAPINIDGRTEAVIMIWDLKFEYLTMYHINLFVTLMKIVLKSVEKASFYRASLENQFNMQYPKLHEISPYLLSEREFMDLVQISEETEMLNAVPFSVVRINTDGLPAENILDLLKPLLKGLFYMYKRPGRLDILLSGLPRDEVENFLHTPEHIADPKFKNIQLVALIDESLTTAPME